MSPRIRRLKSDYERLTKRFEDWPVVRMSGKAGLPPEFYRFTYRLNGLVVSTGGDIVERGEHILEVNLSLGYPRRAPQCKMVHPVFHPNFDDASVCIGDFWAPSESLEDLIVRIGRMIAYQEYNTKSPLNGLAAKWADENQNLLPVDSTEVAPPLERAAPPPVPPAPSPLEAAGPEAPPLTEGSLAEAAPHSDSDAWTGRIIIP